MTRLTRRNALTTLATGAAALPLLLVAARPAQAATHQVKIEGFAFNPADLTVAAGDTVTFTNGDGAPHTATAEDGSFDTGRLSGGASGDITLSTPGSFGYKCQFHPSMTGTITVT